MTASLRILTRDGWLLFATRSLRLFAYGALSVGLVLYLTDLGFSGRQVGLLLALTLIGDTAISLWLTTHADRLGRRRMLVLGAVLMIFAGLVFAATGNFLLLLLAATIGVISPSGNEVGPFLAIEQAALSHVVADEHRTGVFAWYTLAGALATAVGSLFGGVLMEVLTKSGMTFIAGYRAVVLVYVAVGLVLAVLFTRLSGAAEIAAGKDAAATPTRTGLSHSRGVVLRLAGLFSLDAFAGGFVIQSLVAYWFHQRFGVDLALLGAIFFGANLFAGLSALSAASLARRFGLVNTMVFTHLPSNVLLILVPLMPNLPLAIAVLMLRFSISQMDVPTRQSYTMAVVRPEERSAAAGVTGVARTVGAAISQIFAGLLLGSSGIFFVGGGLKIVYDLLLYRSFIKVKPPEERIG